MKKEFPRYRKNIFVKAENHLTRTINTYIEYEKVIKIYLSFNFKKDKYELHLKIDEEYVELPDNVIMIYDRDIALNNRKSMSVILDILNSNDITELFKNSDIEKLKKMVKKYSNEKTDFCDIFNKPSTEIIASIQDFIKIKGHYVQKNSIENEKSKKVIDINKMVAKRMYNYVLNRLNYSKKYFTEFSRLKNKNINKKILREDFVKNEIENIKYKIELIYEIKNKDYSIFEIESLTSYKDIIICLELFDRVDFKLSELTTLKTKKELLYEKSLFEINIDLYNKELNIMNELEYKLKETLSIEFYDYIKLKILFDNKKKNEKKNEKKKNIDFSPLKIMNLLNDFIEKNKWLKKTRGRKRKEALKQFKRLFGINFRQYNNRIRKIKYVYIKGFEKLSEEEKKIALERITKEEKKIKLENYIKFIYLISKMDTVKSNLTIFRKRELFDIFNEKYTLNKKFIEVLKKETVLEEIKIKDGYYDLITSYENDFELLDTFNYEDYYLEENELSNKKKQIDKLTDKYNNRPLHRYAQDYLNKKNQQLQDYNDEFQEKAFEQQTEKEYEEYCMEIYTSNTEESYKKIRKDIKETDSLIFTEYFLIPEIKKWSNIPPQKYKSFYDKIFSRIKMIDEIDYILGKKRVYHRP